MSWVALTKQMVEPRLSTTESKALATFSNPSVDVLQEIIDAVVAKIRNALEQCEKNVMDKDPTTIPHSLLTEAWALIAYELANRCGLFVAEDPRFQTWMRAMDTLDKLRTCEIVAENPNTGETPDNGLTGARVVFSTETRFDRGKWRF